MRDKKIKEAMFYKKLEKKIVNCNLCSHHCRIAEGKRGVCRVRENRDGTLYSLVYGKIIASHVDPIEKKPLFHFLPESYAYSISTIGCNFKCKNCQNWEISQSLNLQVSIFGREESPKEIVRNTLDCGCKSIAYTYTEPVIFMEYAFDICKIAIKNNINNVFVTNGYITEEALRHISPYVHAVNIDLKSFNKKFYRENCGALLEPVLKSIKLHKKLGIWVEITTLVIPALNDSEGELKQIAEFIKDVGPEIPWHVSRFHPDYQLIDLSSTPLKTIEKAREIGLNAGLKYVYQGNVMGAGENTYCYNCSELLIERLGYNITKNKIIDDKCPNCTTKIDGIWK